jgi:hypothetical protein
MRLTPEVVTGVAVFVGTLFVFKTVIKSFKNFSKWEKVAWAVAIFLAGVAAVLLSSGDKSFPGFKDDNVLDDNLEDEDIPEDESVTFLDVQEKDVKMVSTCEVITVSWNHLESLVKDTKFIKQFANAVSESAKIKIKRYSEILRDIKMGKPGGATESGDPTGSLRIHNEIIVNLQEIITVLKKMKTPNIEITKSNLEKVIQKGNSLIGLEPVKDVVARKIYSFSQNPKIFVINFQNICVCGPSGIGKTKLATTLAYMYSRCGILARNKVVKVTKENFTTSYVNESCKRTKSLFMTSLEGVLFIDEAYEMTPVPNMYGGPQIDHGQEAMTELVNCLDKYVGLSMVIASGYEEPMKQRFLGCNEGMPRRFPSVLVLDQYTPKQLYMLCILFLNQTSIVLTQDAAEYLFNMIRKIYIAFPGIFDKQAGDMKNLCSLISEYAVCSMGMTLENDHEEIISQSIREFHSSKKQYKSNGRRTQREV